MQNLISGGASAPAPLRVSRVPAWIVALFPGDIAQLPAQLQPLIQQGYLETEFDDYLTARNGYWIDNEMENFTEEFSKHRGTSITRTRPGLKAPVQVPTDNTAAQTPPNDGLNPSTFAVEQYTFIPFELNDADAIDILGTNFAIVNRFRHIVKMTQHQAEQSMDLLARDTLTAGYAIGVTFATANQATTGANATIQVDDIRGLETAIQNGKVNPVSPTNLLPAVVYVQGNRANFYVVMVNGAVPTLPNTTSMAFVGAGVPGTPLSTRGNGVAGTISVVNLPNAITKGDIVVAGDAPMQIVGVANKLHWSQLSLNSGDSILTSTMLLAAKGYLENQGAEFSRNADGEDEGTFVWHGASNVKLSLYQDPDFKQANQSLGKSEIFKKAEVSEYLGITFVKTTNAPKIPLPGGGYANLSMVTSAGVIRDEWYAGMTDWADSEYNPAYVTLDKGIAQIIMPAFTDKQGRNVSMSWLSIRDMICPTDITRNSVVLTGSGSRRARAVAMWTYTTA